MSKQLVLMPRISEKAYNQSQTAGTYVFQVPMDSNKLTVTKAIEAQFEVTVVGVNMLVKKGKEITRWRKRGGKTVGKRPDLKIAYISLKEGDTINVFPAEEDEKQNKPAPDAKSKKATRSTR